MIQKRTKQTSRVLRLACISVVLLAGAVGDAWGDSVNAKPNENTNPIVVAMTNNQTTQVFG